MEPFLVLTTAIFIIVMRAIFLVTVCHLLTPPLEAPVSLWPKFHLPGLFLPSLAIVSAYAGMWEEVKSQHIIRWQGSLGH